MMVQNKIFKYFEGNPDLHVLFIFDPMGQIEAELLEAKWPDTYRYVVFEGNWFTVKYRLYNEWKDDKVILLFKAMLAPNSQDDNMDFPLYGELKANMVFSEESYLSFMQLKGIPSTHSAYIARHIGELQLSKFEKILENFYDSQHFSIDNCNRGLISGYIGASKLLSWDDIVIRLICLDSPDGDKERIASVFRSLSNNQDAANALDKTLRNICGVSFDYNAADRMRRFAEAFKYNSITQNLTAINADDYKSYKITNSVILQNLNSFRESALNHPSLSEQFIKAINGLAENIHEDKIISWYGVDAEYTYITEHLCWPIIGSIISGKAIANPIECNEKLRAFSLRLPTESSAQEVIDFVSNACFLLEKINALGTLTLKTAKEYITKYTTEFYLVDTYYRLCTGEFKEIPSTGPVYDDLVTFKKYLDEAYAKSVNVLNQEWMKCLRDTGVAPISIDGILHQQYFYEQKLRGVDAKRVIIVSDALRYEVAVELLKGLGDAKHIATLEPALAILPTETKYSKLALLPYSNLTYSNCNITVDGEILDSIEKRTAHVKRYEPDAVCIDFNTLADLSRDQKRELFKSRLVYIFHNTIDSMAHDNPSKLYLACKSSIDEIKKLIPSLHATFNVANVYVTSDHGFLYNDIPFEEKDKYKVEDAFEERKTRYYITDSTESVYGVAKFRMDSVSSMNGGNKLVAVPEGSNRFNAEGGGYQFAHGGGTLQEMIIPVLYSHLRREDKKESVGVTLLGSALTMVSSRLKFSLIQSEAVSEDMKERKVLCGIYEGNNLITNEKEINLNSTDINPQNRFYSVELILSKPASGGLLELRIYDKDDKDRLNPLDKAIVTNKTLIEQDF